MTELNSKTVPAQSGQTKSLVVFLHGYGADGADLLSLAQPMATYLPDTVFVAPDAPHRCSVNPMGYEWFPIPWIDGSSEELATKEMLASAEVLEAWLQGVMDKEGVNSAQTFLVGFSQGTMLSLHQGLRRDGQLAGIVGFSGRLLMPEALSEARCKPPIQLIHGDQDPVVPYADMEIARRALSATGFEVDTFTSSGMGHGIGPDGLGRALEFITRHLPN